MRFQRNINISMGLKNKMQKHKYTRRHTHMPSGRFVLAKRADFSFAASPLAAGIGESHHYITSFSVDGPQRFKHLLWNGRARRPPEQGTFLITLCHRQSIKISGMLGKRRTGEKQRAVCGVSVIRVEQVQYFICATEQMLNNVKYYKTKNGSQWCISLYVHY